MRTDPSGMMMAPWCWGPTTYEDGCYICGGAGDADLRLGEYGGGGGSPSGARDPFAYLYPEGRGYDYDSSQNAVVTTNACPIDDDLPDRGGSSASNPSGSSRSTYYKGGATVTVEDYCDGDIALASLPSISSTGGVPVNYIRIGARRLDWPYKATTIRHGAVIINYNGDTYVLTSGPNGNPQQNYAWLLTGEDAESAAELYTNTVAMWPINSPVTLSDLISIRDNWNSSNYPYSFAWFGRGNNGPAQGSNCWDFAWYAASCLAFTR